MPAKPAPGTYGIRLFNTAATDETAYHYRVDRTFQIIYFGASPTDVLQKIDALGDALYGVRVLPIDKDSNRYLRIGSFSYTQLFQTENDLYARIGVLDCTVRKARTQPEYQKIMHIYARYMTRI